MLGGMMQSIGVGGTVNTSGANLTIDTGNVFDASSQKNIAIGANAMASGTLDNADNNIAIGRDSLNALTQGDNNIAIGTDALNDLTTGTSNVAVGLDAGESILSGSSNTFVGAFCGDDLQTSNQNTAMGYAALGAVAGGNNTAMGYGAGQVNTGADNTFLGFQAGDASTGSYNVVVGSGALGSATAVDKTVAIGNQALFSANDDSANGTVAIGWAAGYYSVPTGDPALAGNTLIGYSSATDVSGANRGLTTGKKNTAVGQQTLGSNAGAALTGNNNTTLGYRAGYALVGAANDNTFVGHDAGEAITGGTQNVLIGSGTVTNAVGDDNSIVIGYGAAGLGSNTAIIGNSSVTDVYMGDNGSTWSTTSDGRLKENVKSWKTGLAEIKKLNIVSYNFKKDNPYGYDTKKVRQGIIAQEAVNAIPEMIDTSKEWMSANQEPMIWALVNAVQELSQQIEDLKKG